ncbi:tripartite tricarboxylate transporter permease [Jiangella asiatica]|uniref:DUF112 domain-containing protein n=1 Tax=Jiangella asiatica TaxID=2530372 RepID=A0A4V2Z0E4_9ACTN|nr:tripartite tricarboxylate transporter permease [Jiangella asiatica]TDE00688.1 hypothetical protein E1269_24825 [Jiangella asiatica]
MDAIVEGLGHLADPTLLFAIVVSVAVAQVIAIIPGLGGAFILAVLIPFAYQLDPLVAIAMLVAATATDGTGNAVTSILFGVPGSATSTALLFDGHPMARNGMAGRAIGAALTASAVGGVIGAVTLALAIPIARPVVLAFGPAEFFIIVVAALFTLAYVREEQFAKGLVSAALGLSLALVGMDAATGTQRYTSDQLYLWDGLRLVPVLIGLFAVAEAISMLRDAREQRAAGQPAPVPAAAASPAGGTLEGVKDVFRHFDATWLGSWIGLVIGMLPGVGGAAGQFMAYSTVAKTSTARGRGRGLPPFGKGNVRGVVGADASTNSTVGGELVPALAFGIPSSSTMAIVLAALVTIGIQPGPEMLEDDLDVVWMIVFVLMVSNLLASGMVLAFVRQLAKLASVRPSLLGPGILAVAFFGAYATSQHVGDIITAAVAGLAGYHLKKYGYGRVTFLIGFVLGPVLEHYLVLSLQIYGPDFLLARPFAATLTGLMAVGIAWSAVKALRARRARPADQVTASGRDG